MLSTIIDGAAQWHCAERVYVHFVWIFWKSSRDFKTIVNK